MIKLTIGELIGIIMLVFVVSTIINNILSHKRKDNYTSCDYIVVSKKTGIEYNCIGIRDNKDNTKEILIYNHISQCFEWWSIYQFEFKGK